MQLYSQKLFFFLPGWPTRWPPLEKLHCRRRSTPSGGHGRSSMKGSPTPTRSNALVSLPSLPRSLPVFVTSSDFFTCEQMWRPPPPPWSSSTPRTTRALRHCRGMYLIFHPHLLISVIKWFLLSSGFLSHFVFGLTERLEYCVDFFLVVHASAGGCIGFIMAR